MTVNVDGQLKCAGARENATCGLQPSARRMLHPLELPENLAVHEQTLPWQRRLLVGEGVSMRCLVGCSSINSAKFRLLPNLRLRPSRVHCELGACSSLQLVIIPGARS